MYTYKAFLKFEMQMFQVKAPFNAIELALAMSCLICGLTQTCLPPGICMSWDINCWLLCDVAV